MLTVSTAAKYGLFNNASLTLWLPANLHVQSFISSPASPDCSPSSNQEADHPLRIIAALPAGL